MHTTMQTLGRVAIIGGGILVALVNVYVFAGVEGLPQAEIVRLYQQVYLMALIIPFVSVLGVGMAWVLKRRQKSELVRQGFSPEQAEQMVNVRDADSRTDEAQLVDSRRKLGLRPVHADGRLRRVSL